MARKTKPRPIPEDTARQSDAIGNLHNFPMAQAASVPSSQSSISSLFNALSNVTVLRAVQLTVLAAAYAVVSQLSLTPVYGAVPSSQYHKYGLPLCGLIAFSLRGYVPREVTRSLPVFCFWIPTIQFVLFKFSSAIGNPLGPFLTELVTFYPLTILTLHTAIELLDERFADNESSQVTEAGPSMGVYLVFTFAVRSVRSFLPQYVGSNIVFTRVGLQVFFAMFFAMAIPQPYLWPALPSVAFTMLANPHNNLARTTEVLNNTLALYDYTLVDRKESITGYISVLEDNKQKFRVMRCDHSLLGGEWTTSTHKVSDKVVAEPIYAIFAMLEAIRLIEPCTPDTNKRALTIGTGTGTAPNALIHHGIKTTIIEIDPVVHDFAVKYFNLNQNHSVYIGDAVGAVAASTKSTRLPVHHDEQYNYIIHDVFTGGVEPAQLFTTEFLTGLNHLLRPGGVVAVNYAGDLSTPVSSLIYRTITSVFSSCRVFREDVPPPTTPQSSSSQSSANLTADFTNMVFFCRRNDATIVSPANVQTQKPTQSSQSSQPITFRTPTEADFLGSQARREFLVPKHEILPETFDKDAQILTVKNIKLLEKWQQQSAVGHWRLMRTVLPDGVWENW